MEIIPLNNHTSDPNNRTYRLYILKLPMGDNMFVSLQLGTSFIFIYNLSLSLMCLADACILRVEVKLERMSLRSFIGS